MTHTPKGCSNRKIIVITYFKTCNNILKNCFDAIDLIMFNPLPDDKMLDWSKLIQIADNILKCN